MGGCLPSCVLWPAQCCAHGYAYSAVNQEVGKHMSMCNSTYICCPDGSVGDDGKARMPMSLMNSVDAIHNAIRGCGTDDERLIREIVNRNPDQISVIQDLYLKKYGTTLVDAIDDDTSGDYQMALLAKVLGQAKMDAEVLHQALHGLGTDEERLNEILTTRHPGQVAEIIKEYRKRDDGMDDLWSDVMDDTSFKYEAFLKCMLNRAGFIAYLVYETMHGNKYDPTGISGLGTNETMLLQLMGGLNRDDSAFHNILRNFQDSFGTGWKDQLERQAFIPDLQEVKAAYVDLYKLGFGVNEERKDMATSIKEDCGKILSTDFRDLLLLLITPKDVSGAELLKNALTSFGGHKPDKKLMIVVAGTRSNYGRMKVAGMYQQLYATTVEEDVQKYCSDGEFSQVFCDMFEDIHYRWADYMYLSINGWDKDCGISISKRDNALEAVFRTGQIFGFGSDSERMIRIVMHTSKHELRKISAAYQEKFGKDLLQEVSESCGTGMFERTLTYKFRRAHSGLVHVPRQSLVRIADMSVPDGLSYKAGAPPLYCDLGSQSRAGTVAPSTKTARTAAEAVCDD